ncbi:protein a6 [Drosophila grimshawi]|uniref:GH24444 n=1 Tax=Drosophila grimshawi TaxID=7222 RepID=B4JLW3_DROGR|nr:protein a6 [Drosophila grimshawi]EDV91724.1 GH24444 [Drosophila grimshawi]
MMNTKHSSEPFFISTNLFDNRRLKRRVCKWMDRLRERQQHFYMHAQAPVPVPIPIPVPVAVPPAPSACKTDRMRRRCHMSSSSMLSRRHVAATLPADITIDLLSDDDDDDGDDDNQTRARTTAPRPSNLTVSNGSLQLSMVPNITLVPAAHSSTMLLMPAGSRNRSRKRCGDVTTTCSIVLTSDDEDGSRILASRRIMRSPPPLAPLTRSSGVGAVVEEEVTVSLVPRNSTTANCQARQASFHSNPSSCSTPSTTSPKTSHFDGYLRVDVDGGDVDAVGALPDETTVHTVIANRIYELSLSKLREGLASSGMPEYAQDLLPEQLQKLSPAMRAKVAPMVAPSPPAPISLKLSSDLSISLISDDDDCDSANGNGMTASATAAGGRGRGVGIDLLHPVVAAEAHAAAKLLKQQQPQLSVVQHLQYPGHGTPVALPVVALGATPPTTNRRRKLG